MMRIVDRYISKIILNSTLIVFLALCGLRLFISIFGELGSIGTGHYGFVQALQYSLLMMPLNMYQLYPNVALIGVLAALGLLASHNELTVLRTAGVSIGKISWMVIKVSMVVIIIVTLIGELLAPSLAAYAEKEQDIAKNGPRAEAALHRLWLREENSFINIGSYENDNQLHDIVRFTFDKNYRLVSADYAKQAELVDGHWRFYDTRTTNFSGDRTTTRTAKETSWKLSFRPHTYSATDPAELSLRQVLNQAKYNQANGRNADNYFLSFWQRLLQPLATLIMVFLAIPFIFGPLRNVTMGLRILSGVMIGLAFYLINRFFGPFSIVYQIPAFMAAGIPVVFFFVVGLILMWRKG